MMIQDFRRRFYWTLVLSIPVLGLSELIQGWLGFSFSFPGADYLVFLLSTVIFLYGGWPFLIGLADELRNRNPGMMTLIGLAIPLVVAVSTSKSAQNGLLIRNRTAFENARRITTVVFDKTGTLTKGNFEVSEVSTFADGYDEDRVVSMAAGFEGHSEHPIGKGLSMRPNGLI
ncbi:HAD family hydrolase [Marispirochaeta aestuarii]|uniref:HAD family hydrolase n=1 Tax=Marispirochaeta aestuarii TaxID=1963862 RepID=UPI002ABE55A6|nr:HAD family hydrolase [Marispirochaeta aestuarii]